MTQSSTTCVDASATFFQAKDVIRDIGVTGFQTCALPIFADAAAGPGAAPDLTAKPGKDVLELAVTDADKGAALVRLRGELGADAVLYLGDDVTDEDAFRSEERRAVKECRSRWSPYDEKHA